MRRSRRPGVAAVPRGSRQSGAAEPRSVIRHRRDPAAAGFRSGTQVVPAPCRRPPRATLTFNTSSPTAMSSERVTAMADVPATPAATAAVCLLLLGRQHVSSGSAPLSVARPQACSRWRSVSPLLIAATISSADELDFRGQQVRVARNPRRTGWPAPHGARGVPTWVRGRGTSTTRSDMVRPRSGRA
jgi:hypothetical protein